MAANEYRANLGLLPYGLVIAPVELVWRWISPPPPHAETENALLDKLCAAAHYALNILVLLVVASGNGLPLQTGLPEIVFGRKGTLPQDFWSYTPRIAHDILTKLLFALIALYVVGGIVPSVYF